MDFKIINENNRTNRIYLQDEIEQNIFKIKNLSLDKEIYRSYLELLFYTELNFIHIAKLLEYKLQKLDKKKDDMKFNDNELEKRKLIYNKKKLLDNNLTIFEENIELSYYRLVIFYKDKNEDIIFIYDNIENIYGHSNIQIHNMMNNFYILEDLSKANFCYFDKTKTLIIQAINYIEHNFSIIDGIDDENMILKIIKKKPKQILKTKIYKNYEKIEEFEKIKTELKICEKKLYIITEPQKIKYKDWIKKNQSLKKESLFFILIIIIYLEKNNCQIDNLSIENFYIREESSEMNYKIEEFEYKINTSFQLYIDLNENNTIKFNKYDFAYNLNFLKKYIILKNDIYKTLHLNFYQFRFLKKFKIKNEKELSVIPYQNYLYQLNNFNLIYLFHEDSYIPVVILKNKNNILYLKDFDGNSLEFNLESKQKIYFIYNKYFNADIIL